MFEGATQLSVAARVLVWALHTCNAQLVTTGAAGREVVVEGIVGVLGRVVASTRREFEAKATERQKVEVAGLPSAVLRLRLEQV